MLSGRAEELRNEVAGRSRSSWLSSVGDGRGLVWGLERWMGGGRGYALRKDGRKPR